MLLRAYVMGGQVAAALAAYAGARERLADELGTDPSPETAALYTAILRGELALPARPRRPPALAGWSAGTVSCASWTRPSRRGPRRVGRGRRGRRRGRHRQDHAAAGLGGPARGRRGHRAAGVVRAAGPARCRWTRCSPRWPTCCASPGPTRPPTCSAPTRPILAPAARRCRTQPAAAAGARDSMLGPAVLYAALVRVLGRLAERAPAGRGDRRRAPGRAGAGGLAAVRPAGPGGGRGGRGGPARRGRAAAGHRVHPPGRARPRRRRRRWSARAGSTSCTRGRRDTRCS